MIIDLSYLDVTQVIEIGEGKYQDIQLHGKYGLDISFLKVLLYCLNLNMYISQEY